jgi:hypothetical protein
MNTAQTPFRSHSNRYSSDRACEHCEGIIRHEPWCITNNEVIRYAYQAVLNAENLSVGDHISLHALGARWVANAPCACAAKQ